ALRIDAARAIFPHLEYTPKVLIVVTEQFPDEGQPQVRMDGAVARQIRQICTEQGLYVIPPEEVLALYAPNELRGYVQGGADRMALLARETLADVAIFGSAVCSRTPAGDAHNTPRFQAQVELKSVGAHQGYVSEWASAEAALNATDARSATEFAFRDAAFKIQRHLLAAAILTAYTQERRAGILL